MNQIFSCNRRIERGEQDGAPRPIDRKGQEKS